MGDRFSTGYCNHCGRQVKVTRPQVNHILHLMMTVFTAGLWLFIWALIVVSDRLDGSIWRRTICGAKKARRVQW